MKKRLQRIMALLLAGMLIFGGCGKEPEEPVAEAEPEFPPVTDLQDLDIKEGDVVRNIAVTVRFYVGWDE